MKTIQESIATSDLVALQACLRAKDSVTALLANKKNPLTFAFEKIQEQQFTASAIQGQ
jgi:hypothetical protein